MSCPENICRLISCKTTDDIPSYLGQFSLQAGLVFINTEITVPSPLYPGGSYTVPPGTIVITVPPGSVNSGSGSTISIQGCQSTVTAAIPAGSSPSQIQAIVNQVMLQIAAQSAICNAAQNPHNPDPSPNPPVTFFDEGATARCSNAPSMKLVGTLPGTVTLSDDTLFLDAGNFASTVSQADANQKAQNFLNSLLGTVVLCGWWNNRQSSSC